MSYKSQFARHITTPLTTYIPLYELSVSFPYTVCSLFGSMHKYSFTHNGVAVLYVDQRYIAFPPASDMLFSFWWLNLQSIITEFAPGLWSAQCQHNPIIQIHLNILCVGYPWKGLDDIFIIFIKEMKRHEKWSAFKWFFCVCVIFLYGHLSYFCRHAVRHVCLDRNGRCRHTQKGTVAVAWLNKTHSEIPERCPGKHFLLINKMVNDVISPKSGVTSLQQCCSYSLNLCVCVVFSFF